MTGDQPDVAEAVGRAAGVDRLDRVADAVTISRRTMGIARQSVVAGMLLSLVAMVAASFGAIPPTAGALLQEGIDLAVGCPDGFARQHHGSVVHRG